MSVWRVGVSTHEATWIQVGRAEFACATWAFGRAPDGPSHGESGTWSHSGILSRRPTEHSAGGIDWVNVQSVVGRVLQRVAASPWDHVRGSVPAGGRPIPGSGAARLARAAPRR